MPFQSEKQRRYMHANLPDIANRWEAKYGLGGIAELNQELNSLPAYYLPKNQGGRIGYEGGLKVWGKSVNEQWDNLNEDQKKYIRENFPDQVPEEAAHGGLIPSHEAGIYGLAEGGRTGFRGGSPHDDSPTGSGSSTSGTGGSTSTSTSGGEGGHGDVAHGPGGRFNQPSAPTTPTEAPPGEKGGAGYISPADQRTLDIKEIISKQEEEKTEKWEQAQQWNKPNKFMSFLGNAALAIIPGLLPAKMATAWNVGKLGWDITKTDRYDRYFELAGINKNEWLSKIESVDDSKRDLYESFADTPNHPERIALQAELEIGKKTTPDGPDGVTQDTSIKIENIEEVNNAKTQLQQKYQEMDEAAYAAWLRQQEMQAKKEAYYKMFRDTYMSAQGGRVPGGYNTGGLSNLFRLKNR